MNVNIDWSVRGVLYSRTEADLRRACLSDLISLEYGIKELEGRVVPHRRGSCYSWSMLVSCNSLLIWEY